MLMLNTLLEHKILFGSILLVILINVICIIYLVLKERKSDKEEIEELVSSLAVAKPREKEVEKEKEPMQLDKVLEQMQQDLDTTPEEVVSNFEQEQEEKSIISYQELLQSLNKEEPIKEEVKKQIVKDMEEIDVIDIDDNVEVTKVESVKAFDDDVKIEKKKFQNSEFISPIFGKDKPKTREAKLESILRNEEMKKTSLEETLDISPLKDEMRKSDEFLRALKDFRSNL